MISIIAILAAMLMPALSTAREKARRATCMSQLKQWGIAMAMYLNNSNYYPWMQTMSTDYTLIDQCGAGCGTPGPCYGPNDICDEHDSRVKYFYLLKYINRGIMNCPTAKRKYTPYTDGTIRRIGYFQVGITPWNKPTRKVKNPAAQPFLADNTWMPGGWPAPTEGVSDYNWSNHKWGKPEGMNAVYAEGHVEWLVMGKYLWWGPFAGYGTTKRCLVPPNSKGSYIGAPPSWWYP